MRRRPPKEVKILDDLCRRLIFLRDKNTCQKCGKTERLQWAHVRTRGVHSTRWEPDNSVALCQGCHYQGHLNPLEFSAWFVGKFPKRAEHLTLLRQTRRKVDRVGLRLWLENEVAKREG